MATPLRWASGKGKIHFQAGAFKKTRLSDAQWKRVVYRTMGIALVIFGTITIVPLVTTLLVKAAVARWDEEARKTCEAYREFKEAQKATPPDHTSSETSIDAHSADIKVKIPNEINKYAGISVEEEESNSAPPPSDHTSSDTSSSTSSEPTSKTIEPNSEPIEVKIPDEINKDACISVEELVEENIPFSADVSEALSRLHLQKKEGDLFITSSGTAINLRQLIEDLGGSHSDRSPMASSNFTFSGIATSPKSSEIICRTAEDMNDLILIGQNLYPEETKSLIFVCNELKRFKTALRETFPEDLIEMFSLYSTILNYRTAFGDMRREDFAARGEANQIMYKVIKKRFTRGGKEIPACMPITRWPTNITLKQRAPTSGFSFNKCIFNTIGIRFCMALMSALEIGRLCINDEAPYYFKGLFPIGMHLVMCDGDERTLEERTVALGEMQRFLTVTREGANKFYEAINSSPS